MLVMVAFRALFSGVGFIPVQWMTWKASVDLTGEILEDLYTIK